MNQKISIFSTIVAIVVLFLASCTAPFTFTYTTDYCADGIQDRGETAIDCGGSYCDPCAVGDACKENDDCESGSCVDDVCAAAEETGTTEETAAETAAEETTSEPSVIQQRSAPTVISATTDSDSDTIPDVDDLCADIDDTIDVDGDDTPDCIDDSDGDGLTDYDEEYTYGTDPNESDIDSDGLTDYEEIITYETDPTVADMDGDGASDQDEILGGTDPAGYSEAAVWIELGDSVTLTLDGTDHAIKLFDYVAADNYCDLNIDGTPVGVTLGSSETVDSLTVSVVDTTGTAGTACELALSTSSS